MDKNDFVKFFNVIYPRLPVTVLTVYIITLAITVLGAATVMPGWLSSVSGALTLQWQGSWVATLAVGAAILPLAILLSVSFWGLGGYVFAGLKGISDGVILAGLVYVVLPSLNLLGGGGVTNAQWVQVIGPVLVLVHGVTIMLFIAWPTGGVHVGTNLFYNLTGANLPEAREPTGKLKEAQMWYCVLAVLLITICFVLTYKFLLP